MLNDVGLAGFFDHLNFLFPLFHKPSFDVYFDKQYSSDPPTDSSWYAAFNIVLAMSCQMRTSRTIATGGQAPRIHAGWKYFQNTVVVLTELLLRNTDLMGIQAMLGMVWIDKSPFILAVFFFF